jgi:DNA uptake protein ComE-like DNA-binding protein
MQLAQLAARDMTAQKRLIAAVNALAKQCGIEVQIDLAVRGTTQQRLIAGVKQREQVADILERICGVGQGQAIVSEEREAPSAITLAELDSLPGIGSATITKVKEYLEARDD